jgi:hypothetical protein
MLWFSWMRWASFSLRPGLHEEAANTIRQIIALNPMVLRITNGCYRSWVAEFWNAHLGTR